MRRIKIAQIAALLFAANAMALAAPYHRSSTAQATGQVRGAVIDTNEARVSGATVTIEGEGTTRTVSTAEDGTYQIEMPTGIYRIRVNNRGFCPARRAAFRMQPSTSTTINFTLIVCPLIHEMKTVNGQDVGEVARYRDPFKEEVFPLTHRSVAPLELVVRYGERREDKSIIEYRGAVVSYDEHAANPAGSARRSEYLGVTISYDALMILADKVQLNTSTFRLEAEGNVIVEDGKRCVRVRRAVVELQTGEPKIELTQ